jgi:hypothetical protein
MTNKGAQMNIWIYRLFMTLLLINLALGVYAAATYVKPPQTCVMGIIMEPRGDMMVQSHIIAQHCMAIDRD